MSKKILLYSVGIVGAKESLGLHGWRGYLFILCMGIAFFGFKLISDEMKRQ